MPQKIAINSKTTGKFEIIDIGGRDHIVTKMVSLVAGSVMNRLAYTYEPVLKSFKQLSNLHAPASHPELDGKNISAFSPFGVHAFGVGGSVDNPVMEGNRVINDLLFDIETANKDDRGKEIIRRIKAGEEIGVSTGLNADIEPQSGMMAGEEFDGIVKNIQFDHVAVLLDETPAGDETFTITNGDVMLCNLADSVRELEDKAHEAVRARFGDDAWPNEILFNPARIIVRKGEGLISIAFGYNDAQDIIFTGEEIPVERKVTFDPITNEADQMNELFIMTLIANAVFGFVNSDKEKLMAMNETGLVAAILANVAEVTVDKATKVINDAGLHVNEITAEAAADFIENADAFREFATQQLANHKEMLDKIVANSEMTLEQLDKMPPATLLSLANSMVPGQDYSLLGTDTTLQNKSGGSVVKLAVGS